MKKERDFFIDPRLSAAQCISLVPVETVHQNLWFTVRNRKGYYTIEDNMSQVAILPIVDNEAIIMVRVFRPIIMDNTLEVPAGGAKGTESPVEAAARELSEETGITIGDLSRFEMLPPLIYSLRSPLLPYIFKIDLTKEEFRSRKAHDNEIMSVECFSFDEIVGKIATGEIYIGLQIAVITRYLILNQSLKLITSS
ncbi:MAG: NUDIX hydrolase [Thermodesulfovibrionales bacterium]